jgi:biopolymer transport protein ExbD
MKKLVRKRKSSIQLDIAPLIDIMFMLLLFFLLTSSFLNPTIPLKLPKAGNKEYVKKQEIIVSVDTKSNVYINRRKITIDTLLPELKRSLSDSETKRIIFMGDEDLRYKKFIKVMDIIKSSGAGEIQIAHKGNKDA